MIDFIKSKDNTVNESIEHLNQKQIESLLSMDNDFSNKVEILNTAMEKLKNNLFSDIENQKLAMR